jgi:hypothetical protein
MNIQFNHSRKSPSFMIVTSVDILAKEITISSSVNPRGGETIAVEVPPPWFIETLQPQDFFMKSVGKARCSDEDNYNKKVGRELAQSRMKPTRLIVLSNQDFGGVRILVLEDKDKNKYVFEKRVGNKQVHFIGYND